MTDKELLDCVTAFDIPVKDGKLQVDKCGLGGHWTVYSTALESTLRRDGEWDDFATDLGPEGPYAFRSYQDALRTAGVI